MVALNFGDKCGFTTHGKKVQVLGAFANSHIPVSSVGGLLDDMLRVSTSGRLMAKNLSINSR
jgi:hypothetical protein